MRAFDLSGYDGVLAFGETLSEVYRRWGWRDRVWTWHEAADISVFHPPDVDTERKGLVWIGNWGDGERSEEIETYLLKRLPPMFCRSMFTACVIPQMPGRPWRVMAPPTAAGHRTPTRQAFSPGISPPSMCLGAFMPPCCGDPDNPCLRGTGLRSAARLRTLE